MLTADGKGTILVETPDLPGAVTFGEDRDDSLARATDAIEYALRGAVAAREDLPDPKATGATYVTLGALASAKGELYRTLRAQRIGKAQLAKRHGVALPRIDRLLDLKHQCRIDAWERVFAALGRSMRIVVEAA